MELKAACINGANVYRRGWIRRGRNGGNVNGWKCHSWCSKLVYFQELWKWRELFLSSQQDRVLHYPGHSQDQVPVKESGVTNICMCEAIVFFPDHTLKLVDQYQALHGQVHNLGGHQQWNKHCRHLGLLKQLGEKKWIKSFKKIYNRPVTSASGRYTRLGTVSTNNTSSLFTI